MGKRTTTIFDTFLALYDLLQAQTWPAHPVTGEVPLVYFGDDRNVPQEGIFLVGVPADDARQEWKTMGAPSKDETFTLRVLIGARVVGQDRRAAVERIRDLHVVAESAIRDQTTGRPTGGFVEAVGGVQFMTWSLVTTAPAFGPLPDGGDGAGTEIDITFTARI